MTEKKNKAIVAEAFDLLFNKRDYKAADRFWSPNYIQKQRPYRTRTPRSLRPYQKPTRHAAL